MRTRTPEQNQALFTWLKPSEVAPLIGADTEAQVRDLIRGGHLEAIDVSRSSKPRYRVSPKAIEKYNAESAKRVQKAG